MAVPCDACQQPVNEQASQCPHCGARLRTAAPGLTLSRDEARALLTLHERERDAKQHGMFATLVLPHGRTHGAALIFELALALFAAPVILAGTPMVALSHYRRRRSAAHAVPAELGSVGLISILGAPMAGFGLLMLGVPGVIAGALVAGMVIGLLGRAVIRRHADEQHGRALSQLDAPAEPPAPLPVAVVHSAPPSSSPGTLAPLAGASPEPSVRDLRVATDRTAGTLRRCRISG